MRKSYLIRILIMIICLSACGKEQAPLEEKKTQITIYAAKSLNGVMDEMIHSYQEEHPDLEIIPNYDGSGSLMEQILAGADCDLFFSAGVKQMNTLEEAGLLVENSRRDVVNNQVCVVTYKDSKTKVTGLKDLDQAESLAIADGSVPVGKYTRQALVSSGILKECEDVSQITTQEISQALSGVEINECANVGAVAAAISQAANEVGTVYLSDTTGYEDQLVILEMISNELTGDVIYPLAQIVNPEADDTQREAASAFLTYLCSDACKEYYEKYHFDTNVE